MTDKFNVELCPLQPRADWTGKWIWVHRSESYATRNSYAFFRKKFSASGNLHIDISADTRYELYFDGRKIARGTAPSHSVYKSFDTYTVDADAGEHVVAVLVHHIGENCATVMKSRPGLLVEISAGESTIVSDSTWKVLPGTCFSQDMPVMMSHFGFYEVCDYRKMPEKWNELSFDDSTWACAEVVGDAGCEPWISLAPKDIPNLETTILDFKNVVNHGIYEERAVNPAEPDITVAVQMVARKRIVFADLPASIPVRLGSEKNEFVTIDFGREVTGHVRILLDSVTNGQQIDIGYDEILDERGLPNPRRTYVHFADRFYLREGQRELEVFDGRGFRYLLIDVPTGKNGLVITGVQIDERTYPVRNNGTFRCSNEKLDELYQIGLQTTRLCMLDTYVDCPSRERVLWMDSYFEGICSSYGMGITGLWRRVLYLFAQNTTDMEELVGAVKGFVPTDREAVVQTYMMYYICSISDYVLHTGDMRTAEALLETAMNQFAVLDKFTNEEGLIDDRWNQWQFVDWSAMDNDGISASINAVYLVMHRKMARLARQLGKMSLASQMESKLEKLTNAYMKMFWSQDEGLFIDAVKSGVRSEVRSQLSNALAVWAGVVKGDEARRIIQKITDKSNLLPVTPGDFRLKPGFKCQTGGIVPIGTPGLGTILATVMFELGMDKEATTYLEEAWAPLAVNGTFAEHFGFDTNTSFCHGWSAAPVTLFPKYILGVRPLTPGWTQVEINPHPGNLDWAEGTIPTPLGDVHISWRKTGDGLKIEKHLPAGMVESKRQLSSKEKVVSVSQ